VHLCNKRSHRKDLDVQARTLPLPVCLYPNNRFFTYIPSAPMSCAGRKSLRTLPGPVTQPFGPQANLAWPLIVCWVNKSDGNPLEPSSSIHGAKRSFIAWDSLGCPDGSACSNCSWDVEYFMWWLIPDMYRMNGMYSHYILSRCTRIYLVFGPIRACLCGGFNTLSPGNLTEP
jgi:hypothetical protein